MIHHRVFPAIESDGTDSLHELVTMRGYDAEVGPCYAGDATIELLRVAGRGADPAGADRDDRRLLAGGRHELAGRHDARAASNLPMSGPGARRRPRARPTPTSPTPTRTSPACPHATFLRLRRDDPVSWWDEDHAGGRGFWAVTRHADLLKVSRDVEHVLQRPGHPPRGDGRRGDRGPAHDDGARPARAHGVPAAGVQAVQPARGVRLRAGDPHARPRRSIDDALAGGPSFDFVDRIAKQLPMRMLGTLLGVPDDDGPWLVERGDALLGNTDPEFTTHPVGLVDTDEFRLMPFRSPAGIELFRYAQEQARQRREHPTDDVISDLLRAEDRRRGAQRARVQQLLHAARRRRQRHDALHDDGRASRR